MTFLLISTLGNQYRFILSYDIVVGGEVIGITGIRKGKTNDTGLLE